jgi:transposase
VWDALVVWFGKQAKGVVLRHVDGSYIKLHQHGLQGSKLGHEKQAIGLSRGGMTTKLPAAVGEDGLLCDFVLCAGNFHDLTAARLMLESFRGTHWVGDKGFDSQAFRQQLTEHRAVDSTIPRKGYQTLDEQPQPFNRQNYAKRHLIENFFQRMKAHKHLALRSEKTASSFAGFITFAAFLDRTHLA